jgi:hypothetical protein
MAKVSIIHVSIEIQLRKDVVQATMPEGRVDRTLGLGDIGQWVVRFLKMSVC